jgi:hypothetical protein
LQQIGEHVRTHRQGVLAAGNFSDSSTSGLAYFVGDDLPCVSCGEWVDFEFTKKHMRK